MLVMPSNESPVTSLSSRNVNGRCGSMETSHSDSLAISTAIGLMSTPYRQCSMIWRRALMTSGSAATSRARPASTGASAMSAARVDVALGGPGLDELVGQVAAGGDEERAGAHGDVGHPQRQDLLGGAQLPGRAIRGLQRPGGVDQRFQGALGDLFGEEPRRVVGAGAGPQRGLGHVERAGQDDHRVAAQVLADDPVERQQSLDQGVVVGDGVQPGPAWARSSPASGASFGRQRPGRADAGVLVELGQFGGERFRGNVCRGDGLQRRSSGTSSSRPVLADQADHGLGGAEALEGQQALVDVADLLHGQGAERDRAQLPADDTVCTARSMCRTVRSSTAAAARLASSRPRPSSHGCRPGRTATRRGRSARAPDGTTPR